MELHITKYGTIKPSDANGPLKEWPITKFLRKLNRNAGKICYTQDESDIGNFSIYPKATVRQSGEKTYLIEIGDWNYELNMSNIPSVFSIILKTKLDELISRSINLKQEAKIVEKIENGDMQDEIEDIKDFDIYLKHLKHIRLNNRIKETATVCPTLIVLTLFIRWLLKVFSVHWALLIPVFFGEAFGTLLITDFIINICQYDPSVPFKFNKIANYKIGMIKQIKALKKKMQVTKETTSEEVAAAKNDPSKGITRSNTNNYNIVANYLALCLNDILKLDRSMQLKKLTELNEMIARFKKTAIEVENSGFLKKRSRSSVERSLALDMLKEIRDFDMSVKGTMSQDMEKQLDKNSDISMESMERLVAYYIDAISQSVNTQEEESSGRAHTLELGQGN